MKKAIKKVLKKVALVAFKYSLDETLDQALDEYEREKDLTHEERIAVSKYHRWLRESLIDEIRGD